MPRLYLDLNIELVLVVLPLLSASASETQEFLNAGEAGSLSLLEEMLQRPHDPDMADESRIS